MMHHQSIDAKMTNKPEFSLSSAALRAARAVLQVQQVEVASLAKWSLPSVQRFERGSNVSQARLRILVEALAGMGIEFGPGQLKHPNLSQMSVRSRAARELLRWSQSQAAEAAGLTRPTVSRLETEETDSHDSTIISLMRAYKDAGVSFEAETMISSLL
ncbi:helix-turn-helix domain-containing protein [Niveispirillum sp. SYP-B3756]|uniref:helix-turn-helix transcriptional regulator n=1 Tax=Niveispirillum sp. SYP-B3756 TaxID=2662178 RepID=UPI001290DCA6|nr:helix-turn-helix transcriptional regulator [Niveispirillum sp. SYP-B3756]MQP68142.1 helix-turn-helix domain-containing protein [Niveispirillum sp. SYP-B3756]